MRQARKENILGTLKAIVASPMVGEYLLGLTKKSIITRFASYRSEGKFEHMVVLENNLTGRQALALEGFLVASKSQDKRSLLYRKYQELRRDRVHHASVGGADPDDRNSIYSVYVVWKLEPSDW